MSVFPPMAASVWPDWSTLWLASQPRWGLEDSNLILVHLPGFSCWTDMFLDQVSTLESSLPCGLGKGGQHNRSGIYLLEETIRLKGKSALPKER